jgi:hypothetical protein
MLFPARSAAIALTALSISGCIATTPPTTTEPAPRDVLLAGSADQVWSRLLVVLTDLNLPVENMDKASWFMRTQEMRLSRQDAIDSFDCGTEMGSERVGTIQMYARVTILLRPGTDSTGVRVQVNPRGWDAVNARLAAQGNMFAGDPNVRCVSLGKIESNVLNALGAKP